MCTRFPPELWRQIALCCSTGSLAGLCLAGHAWADVCGPILYGSIFLRVYGRIDQDRRLLACVRTLREASDKAAMVRHLLVIYPDLISAANTRYQTDELCSVLPLLPALTDLRVRTDDLWTRDWIAIFQAFTSRISVSPFKLKVIHVPSLWLVGGGLENALDHHRDSLRTIAVCGGDLDGTRIATSFERSLRGGRVKIFAYERTSFKRPFDVLEIYPAVYLGAADWAAMYFQDVACSFTDPAPSALETWQLSRSGIRLLALHFRTSAEVRLSEPLVRLVQPAFPNINSLEINGPVGVLHHPRLDAHDVSAAVRPFPHLQHLSLGSWTFDRENLEELGEVLHNVGCRKIRQVTLPDGSVVGAADIWGRDA